MDVENVDLAAVADMLSVALEGRGSAGFVRGRTALRDLTVTRLHCSELEAERLVDTMIGRGFLRYAGDATQAEGFGEWRVERPTR